MYFRPMHRPLSFDGLFYLGQSCAYAPLTPYKFYFNHVIVSKLSLSRKMEIRANIVTARGNFDTQFNIFREQPTLGNQFFGRYVYFFQVVVTISVSLRNR